MDLDGTKMADIITALKLRIDDQRTPIRLNVVLGKLLDGAARALQRRTCDAHIPISVKFMDDEGLSEGAVDILTSITSE